jgi:hypothetical protein
MWPVGVGVGVLRVQASAAAVADNVHMHGGYSSTWRMHQGSALAPAQ